jgi:hypothetical protein
VPFALSAAGILVVTWQDSSRQMRARRSKRTPTTQSERRKNDATSSHPHQDGDSRYDQDSQRGSDHSHELFAPIAMRANLLMVGRLRRSRVKIE